MPLMFFPDNTVLINFGIIDRYDLLDALTRGNGRWCITVAQECDRSAAHHPAMSKAASVFGDPIHPDARENNDAQLLRKTMVDPTDLDDHPYKHLGEAETITIVVTRGWATTSLFLTDDEEAGKRARADLIGVATTWDLLRLARKYQPDAFDDDAAWTAVQELDRHGRVRRPCPPVSKGRAVFLAWLHA